MNVANNFYRRLQLQEDRLVGKDVHAREAQLIDILFTYLDVLISVLLLGLYPYLLVLLEI